MSLEEWMEKTEKREGVIGRAFLFLLLCATCAAFPVPAMLICLTGMVALTALVIVTVFVTALWAVLHFAAWQWSLVKSERKMKTIWWVKEIMRTASLCFAVGITIFLFFGIQPTWTHVSVFAAFYFVFLMLAAVVGTEIGRRREQ